MCEAIAAGACTVAEVHKATRSGDGGCNATRCTPVIAEILKNGGRPLTGKMREKSQSDTQNKTENNTENNTENDTENDDFLNW